MDPGPVARRGRDDRRVQAGRTRRSGRDRDRALHARVLADRRVAVGRGDADGHRDGTGADHTGPRPGTLRLTPGSRPFPEIRAPRRAVASGAAAALLGGARRPGRGLDQARGPAAARVRWQQAPNLEFLVGAALAEGADSLVTTGRRWSNHARLTAAAGASAGLTSISSCPARRPSRPTRASASMSCSARPSIRRRRTTARSARRWSRRSRGASRRRAPAVRHPDGGIGVVGAVGQVLAGLELLERRATLASSGDLVVPSATGGTQAGLLVGVRRPARRGGPTASRSRPVASFGRYRGDRRGARRSTACAVDASENELTTTQLGAGYGRPTEAAAEATRLLARTEGILVDPIYTAKALAGLVARVRRAARRPAGGLLARRRDARPVRAARRRRLLMAEASRTIPAMDHRRAQRRELVILAIAVIGPSRLLDGPLVWLDGRVARGSRGGRSRRVHRRRPSPGRASRGGDPAGARGCGVARGDPGGSARDPARPGPRGGLGPHRPDTRVRGLARGP